MNETVCPQEVQQYEINKHHRAYLISEAFKRGLKGWVYDIRGVD